MQNGFGIIDFVALGIYFTLVLAVGIIYSSSQKGITQYFLAGRSMNWFFIGVSLFITTVSSEHVIGYANSGYTEGFASGNFAWGACFSLLLLAWFFIPIYLKNKLFTTPEFIEKRFGKTNRVFISFFCIVVYVITKLSITLFSGALFLEALLGWDKYTSSLVLVLLSGIFTVAVGFKGLLYTHVFHAFVVIAGAIIVTVVGINEIGGLEMFNRLPVSHVHVFKPADDISYPWTGILLGAPILEVWYWCTDQYMVQRVLSAKDIPNARRGAIFGGYLMLLPAIILLVPGLIVYLKFGPSGAIEGRTFFYLVSEILPTGVKAIAIMCLLSALISSLAACFNSISTLFTLDIYQKIYPNANEFQLVTIGKLATLISTIIGIIWVSFINYYSGDIIRSLQSLQSYIAPPLTAIFLVGVIWSRANKFGTFAVLMIGAAFVLFRMGLDIYADQLPAESIFYQLTKVNFLHEAFFLFLFYILLMVVVSLLTAAPSTDKIYGLTYLYRKNIAYSDNLSAEKNILWKKQDVWLSILLVITLLSIWGFLMLY